MHESNKPLKEITHCVGVEPSSTKWSSVTAALKPAADVFDGDFFKAMFQRAIEGLFCFWGETSNELFELRPKEINGI